MNYHNESSDKSRRKSDAIQCQWKRAALNIPLQLINQYKSVFFQRWEFCNDWCVETEQTFTCNRLDAMLIYEQKTDRNLKLNEYLN